MAGVLRAGKVRHAEQLKPRRSMRVAHTHALTTHALNGCALKRCTGTAALGCGPWRSLRSRPLANVSTLLTDPGWLTWLANLAG